MIISNYWHFPSEKKSSRYNTIIEMLSKEHDLKVELITSKFYHRDKDFRHFKDVLDYKVTLIDERKYDKNISLKRIIAHKKFEDNVLNYLRNKQNVDLIYLFVPPIGLGKSIIKLAKKRNIKVIIDVLDLWPEAFNMVISRPKFLSSILFNPMKRNSRFIYSNADSAFSVSASYSSIINKFRHYEKCQTVFIGIDLPYVDEVLSNIGSEKFMENDIFNLVYAGTLGHSYDIKLVIDSLSEIVQYHNVNNIIFNVFGDGPKKNEYEQYAKKKNINCIFHGQVAYDIMLSELSKADLLVNPIVPKAAQSIINKHADYAVVGKPVVSTQDSFEYISLLEKYNAGLSSQAGNVESLTHNILYFYNNPEISAKMGKNHREMCEELFDRNMTYKKILEKIYSLI
ncbi:glycosyltransferase family 4 protein [Enterococcus sp. RIT-PI-f]|uniref:glycosyltransferase family 4 protein n=1 Tax=Enterococcus sp. RIT-PI-f TaxID=1690244 RepID=UPI001F3C20FF|nr:glycosyltransferase family 4 protein [Enterococcus sp. RIT-PI-f]